MILNKQMRQPKINKPIKKAGLSTIGKREEEEWFCVKVSSFTKQQIRGFRTDLNKFCKDYFNKKEETEAKDY